MANTPIGKQGLPIVSLGLLTAAVLYIAFLASLTPGFPYQDGMAEKAASAVLALLAVSLFLERAMAVVNAIVFGDALKQAENNLRLGITDAKLKALADVMGRKERVRLMGAFIAALFVSAAGVRTLEALLVIDTASKNPYLLPVDVILTASLLAGGSNGLAFLAQLIKDKLAPLLDDDAQPSPTPGPTPGPAPAPAPTPGPTPGPAPAPAPLPTPPTTLSPSPTPTPTPPAPNGGKGVATGSTLTARLTTS